MMYKLIKIGLIILTAIVLSACGGGSSDFDPLLQSIDINKIEAYANSNGTSEVPTIQDYIDAGVVGVNEENLPDINQVVENLMAEDVDTKEEIQALLDALGLSLTPAPEPDPTPEQDPEPTDTIAPVFTSSNAASVNENQTSAITLVATDESTVTYSISGTNADSFILNATTGVVTFNTAPDFEIKDSYTFTARATDTSANASDQTVTINILDVDEGIIHNGIPYGTVSSPLTGKVWLDRNLGAARVCTTYNDTACYGDYYQWGRMTDGHEDSLSDTNTTQATNVNNVGHGFFINSHFDWTLVDSTGTIRHLNWSKVDGSFVCPIGYRVPTIQEIRLETTQDPHKIRNYIEAFEHFLKLPSAESRSYSDGTGTNLTNWGFISSSTPSNKADQMIAQYYSPSSAGEWESFRANGYSIRCIKD